ncbi:MAG: hypothetical protein ACSLFR_05905 [Solirubrobacteraceae bacterium]
MRWLPVLAALVLSACGATEEELAPPTEAVPLPETARVAGHSYECPVSPDECFRYLIVAPALDSAPVGTTTRTLTADLQRTLRAKGWAEDGSAFRSPGGSAVISLSTGGDWSDRLAGQFRGMVDADQPALAVTLARP